MISTHEGTRDCIGRPNFILGFQISDLEFHMSLLTFRRAAYLAQKSVSKEPRFHYFSEFQGQPLTSLICNELIDVFKDSTAVCFSLSARFEDLTDNYSYCSKLGKCGVGISSQGQQSIPCGSFLVFFSQIGIISTQNFLVNLSSWAKCGGRLCQRVICLHTHTPWK